MSWHRLALLGAAGAALYYFGGRPREEQALTFVAPRDLELTRLELTVFDSEPPNGEAQSGSSWSSERSQARIDQGLHLAPGRYTLEFSVTGVVPCDASARCDGAREHWVERHSVELDGEPRVIRLRGP